MPPNPHPPTSYPPEAIAPEATLTPTQVNTIGLPLMLGALAGSGLLYWLIWGLPSLAAGWQRLGLWIIPLLLLGIVVHEALHAAGWRLFAGVPWRDITFGIHWKALMPYAHCRVPVPARAYRWAGALPGLLTGLLPVLLALIFGWGGLLILGAILLSSAAGDALIIWALRGVPANARVVDHPSLPGSLVLKEP